MKLLQILIIALLIVPTVIAQDDLLEETGVSIDKSVEWVVQQPKSKSFESALAVLAATKSDLVSNQDAIEDLTPFRSKTKYCWPSSKCTVKDTAMALLALSRTGSTVSFDWMDSQEKVNTQGEWFLQIDTQATGTCNINYENKQKTVDIEDSRIKSSICPQSTQFNLNDCLEPNLLSDKTSLDITVQCGSLGAGKISLIYKIDEKIYLMGEVSTNVYSILPIKNSHFGEFEGTLYTAWAYKSMGKEPNSLAWLRRFYTPNIENSALMYLITEQDQYINDLLDLQNKDTGNFGSVYETSLAVLALRKQGTHMIEVELAKSWLESRMLDDGSWNKDISDTAMAIYGAFASLDLDITPITTTTPTEELKECNENGLCESFLGETSLSCPSDCSCGDGICDDSENEFFCSEDCEKEEVEEEEFVEDFEDFEEEDEGFGFFFWFFILLILLGLIGFGFYYFKNYYKTGKKFTFNFTFWKPKQPPLLKQPIYQPKTAYKLKQTVYKPQPKPGKTLIEKQLEESIKEAKKILGKK